MAHILIIEDEIKMARAIAQLLLKVGYKTTNTYDGQVALHLFNQQPFDLILLDLNLPKINGFELCKIFRLQNPSVPIMVSTAFFDIDTKVQLFDSGADDFLVKPYHLEELLAKVQIFLKRSQNLKLEQSKALQFGALHISASEKTVFYKEEQIVLTPKEFSLLLYLIKKNGNVASKEELVRHIWNDRVGVSNNTIEVYINFLRNKIDKPFSLNFIKTKPGFGYYVNLSL